MRLFLPGWEGNTNIKWLRRLEVTDRPAYTHDESRAYAETLADGSLEGFSMFMGVKSAIMHPSAGQQLPDTGFYEVSGLAWSGFGKIRSVEVSDDNGKTWIPAKLQGPVLRKSLTRFALPWKWDGRPVHLMSRAVDEWGNTQPTHQEWIHGRVLQSLQRHPDLGDQQRRSHLQCFLIFRHFASAYFPAQYALD